MGDQWDWINSYCEICNAELSDSSGRCIRHSDRRKYKTHDELKKETKRNLISQLETLIDDIKFVRNPDNSKDEAKQLLKLIKKINDT